MTAHGGIPGITMGHGNPAAAAAAGESERCTECGIRFGYHSADCSALTALRAAAAALATPAAAAESLSCAADDIDYCLTQINKGLEIHGLVNNAMLVIRAALATPAAAAEVSDAQIDAIDLRAIRAESADKWLLAYARCVLALRTAGSKS